MAEWLNLLKNLKNITLKEAVKKILVLAILFPILYFVWVFLIFNVL